MSTLEVEIPDLLLQQVNELAAKEKLTVDQIVAIALAAHVDARPVRKSIAERAKRANLAEFDRILAKVPDVPPMPGDELPPGYVSPLK